MKDYKEVDERFDKIFNIDVFCSSQANLLWDKFKAHLHTELARERIEGARELAEKLKPFFREGTFDSYLEVKEGVFNEILAELETKLTKGE